MDNTSNNKDKCSPHLGKIIFACWGAAVGLFILSVVLGMFIFGFEATDEYLFKYSGLLLIAYMVISYPVIKKKLK